MREGANLSMCSMALQPCAACQTTFKGLRPHDSTGVRQGCCSRDREIASLANKLWSQRDSAWCSSTFMMPHCPPSLLVTLCISPYDPTPEHPPVGTEKESQRHGAWSAAGGNRPRAFEPANDSGQSSAMYRLGCTATRALRGGGPAMDEGTSGGGAFAAEALAAGAAVRPELDCVGAGAATEGEAAAALGAATASVALLFFPLPMCL